MLGGQQDATPEANPHVALPTLDCTTLNAYSTHRRTMHTRYSDPLR